MASRLTDERIVEIERLSTMATNYLWGVDERDGSVYANVYGELVVPLVELDNPISASRDIVETIRAIPDLLAEVKALRGQNEWLEKIRWMHNEDAQFMLDEISRVSKEVKALKAEKAQAEAERDVLLHELLKETHSSLCEDPERPCPFDEETEGDYCSNECANADPETCWRKYAQQQAEKKGSR